MLDDQNTWISLLSYSNETTLKLILENQCQNALIFLKITDKWSDTQKELLQS